LWRAWRLAQQADDATAVTLRSAWMMLLLMAVHSQLEYPLWYAYFLLPTAWLFGYALGRPAAAAGVSGTAPPRGLFSAGVLLAVGSVLSLVDYSRVALIFAPPRDGSTLEQRIASGQRSWLFAHHAGYAAATVDDGVGAADPAFKVAPHYLLDTRLMIAWAQALARAGETDKARHLAQRLREFRNPQAEAFFEPCDRPDPQQPPPFQCEPPQHVPAWRDYLR
jgi:hypothetical protein